MDIIVQGDDSDPDGDDQDVTGATSPNWTVTVHGDNALTFVLVENFNGDTAITYTIDDGNGGMA
ncbi:Ig-like domain-containing protein [Octadecabacter antarcticus]|uniref:Ig-like domain-containing protein n=1 Tax=Octadecabacter antarcticus TaxID=1217908 RepID=UPI0001806B04|nr:Ig-like domain-containing protein [Octadecabacter antarcticus]